MSFTASATIIAMTMSVFEFSEPGNTSAFTRHISNQPRPTPLPDFDIAAFISNTEPNNSEQF